ncbi:MAG: nitronate monooxygenase [Ilumatobacteraceae bacterium]
MAWWQRAELFDERPRRRAHRGADGVLDRPRFIAPRERAVNGYKESLLELPEDGTVISRAFTGKTCRVIRNDWTQHYEQRSRSPQAVASAQAGVQPPRRPERHRCRRPQGVHALRPGCRAIHELVPAGDLVRQMVAEAEAVIDRVASIRR